MRRRARVEEGSVFLPWCWVSRRVRAYVINRPGSWAQVRDRSLPECKEPPLGAHLVTPRIGFVHHGIYVGEGRVIHCGAVSCFLPRGPVEEVSLRDFSRGRPVALREGFSPKFGALEVIERARSRLGENHYRLLTNNCEHFCEWCLRGRHHSYQVERLARWMHPVNVIAGATRGAFEGS